MLPNRHADDLAPAASPPRAFCFSNPHHHGGKHGRPPQRLAQQALMQAVPPRVAHGACRVPARLTRRCATIAKKLIRKAKNGDMGAVKQIADRIDGKTGAIGRDGRRLCSRMRVPLPSSGSDEDPIAPGQAMRGPRARNTCARGVHSPDEWDAVALTFRRAGGAGTSPSRSRSRVGVLTMAMPGNRS